MAPKTGTFRVTQHRDSVTAKIEWQALSVIPVCLGSGDCLGFIICHRATLWDVHSVHVTPMELWGDQDSVNSSLGTAFVSRLWLVGVAISVCWGHMVSTNQILMDVNLVTAFQKEQEMVTPRDQVKLNLIRLHIWANGKCPTCVYEVLMKWSLTSLKKFKRLKS